MILETTKMEGGKMQCVELVYKIINGITDKISNSINRRAFEILYSITITGIVEDIRDHYLDDDSDEDTEGNREATEEETSIINLIDKLVKYRAVFNELLDYDCYKNRREIHPDIIEPIREVYNAYHKVDECLTPTFHFAKYLHRLIPFCYD